MTGRAAERPLILLVTLNTPAHLHGLGLLDGRHVCNITVAFRAIKALLHVRPMAEADEVRHVVNLGPDDWLFSIPFALEVLEGITIGPHIAMTAHTRVQRGDSCGRSSSCRRVTVLTWNLSRPGMQIVREFNRLIWMVTDIVHCISWCPPVGPELMSASASTGYQQD